MTGRSLRKSIGNALIKTKAPERRTKLRGKFMFRSLGRRVLEYIEWIGDLSLYDGSDNMFKNIRLAKSKKDDQEMCLKDRSTLLVKPKERSSEDIEYIHSMIEELNLLKRYNEDLRKELAATILYQYLEPQRTVIREGHPAYSLYYVLRGELKIYKDKIDKKTGAVTTIEVTNLQKGDMFGEIALLQAIPRSATVVTTSIVELLIITKRTFDYVLRNFLEERWDGLRDALVNFDYFKHWNEEIMRECCILSKIVSYDANEVLLGDGKGPVHYVFFVLSGECRLIEHMLVKTINNGKNLKYKLYNPKCEKKYSITSLLKRRKKSQVDQVLSALEADVRLSESDLELVDSYESESKLMSEKKTTPKVVMDRMSIVTVALQDVINEWHAISEAVEMLMKQPSTVSQQKYPQNVETIFMQISTMYRGACFGLGENMKNRRIVTLTPCRCLLVPRYWLMKYNRANIWDRVQYFLDYNYPSTDELFKKFVNNRMWAQHRRDYVKHILKTRRHLPNNTKNYNVPYSIRINEITIPDDLL